MNYTNEDNLKIMFLCGMLACITVLVGFMIMDNDGIYAYEDGNAAFIAGEACVIDMPEDMGIVDFTMKSNWCWTTHTTHFGGK